MPAAAYVTVAEMRAWLGEPDTLNDAKIKDAIDSACSAIETHCGRDFALAERTEHIFGNGGSYLFPRNTPVTAVASCTVEGVAIPVSFDVMGVKRKDGGRFDIHSTAILVYTAGYATLPDDVVRATKLTAQAFYSAPAYDQNLAGQSTAGFGSQMFAPTGPGSIPRAALTLLEGWKRRS